jgi:hypothetical protein
MSRKPICPFLRRVSTGIDVPTSVAIASGPSTVVQQIQASKLRALAHWGEHPLAALPGVPSLTQAVRRIGTLE